ncbi:MAG: glutamate racemase [Flavipsychrobacter sp.]
MAAPIGIFDSGYGGLTVFKAIKEKMPEYDYIYLGDNARAPYGDRSFEAVYHFTLEAVKWLFDQGCQLIILACNTASAKALKTIQMHDLPLLGSEKRVLGVIRPTAEIIGQYSDSKTVGILGTKGTILSNTYPIEINKFYPELNVYQQACPLWVPIIEHKMADKKEADAIVQMDIESLLAQSKNIDTILLGCTHYPLLEETIKKHLPEGISTISQADIVADSLQDYLSRHKDIEQNIGKNGHIAFYTTDNTEDFNTNAQTFFGSSIQSTHVDIQH